MRNHLRASSGKHNNWSLSTNTGENLLDPDRDPAKNLQFLLFLFATIKAVDVYGDLLRVSVATAGNDHRLGGNEAPPAIVSMFIGDDLEAVLDIVEKDLESEAKEVQTMKPGAKVLPHFIKDTTDRNRTSPFAFTGNKFEFRMPGSALSVSEPNIVINTAVAEVLGEFADRLEGLSGKALEAEIHLLLKEVLRDHRHIVFNGNGYTSEWVEEAHKRGLFDLPSCAEAFPRLIAEKNVELFLKHGIYTKEELFSRYEIKEENYIKTINIEAKTMLSMMKKTFLPSVLSYCKELKPPQRQRQSCRTHRSAPRANCLRSCPVSTPRFPRKPKHWQRLKKRQNPWKIISRRLHISTIRFLPRWMT